MKKDYYVYTHCDKKGNIFYIGKGRGNRCKSKKRNNLWLEKVNDIGEYFIEIPYDNLTEEEALDCEALLIELYKHNNLVNLSHPSPKSDNTLYYDIMQKAKDIKTLYDILDNFDEYSKNKQFNKLIKLVLFTEKIKKQTDKLKVKYAI